MTSELLTPFPSIGEDDSDSQANTVHHPGIAEAHFELFYH